MQSAEVLKSLSNIRNEVETHLRTVKEYRAFLAIQTAMDEISHVGELHSPLEDVREGVRARLNETREYRALLAVEKSITDISGVLGLLDEIKPRPVATVAAVAPTEPVFADVAAEAHVEEQAAAQPEAVAAETAAAAPSDVEANTTPPLVTGETAASETSAPDGAEIIVPTEFAADVQPTFEATPASVEHDVDSLHVAFEAIPVEAIDTPAPLVAAAESNLESQLSGFGAEQAHEQQYQTVPEHDQGIAKVA